MRLSSADSTSIAPSTRRRAVTFPAVAAALADHTGCTRAVLDRHYVLICSDRGDILVADADVQQLVERGILNPTLTAAITRAQSDADLSWAVSRDTRVYFELLTVA